VILTTVDLDENKVALARENISRAGAAASVQVFHGDALDYATRFEEIAFCFSISSLRKTTPRSTRKWSAPRARRMARHR